ncbi:MAG: ATP-binding cassette domain-containing protein [Thermodesulfobacteriota bacterium]
MSVGVHGPPIIQVEDLVAGYGETVILDRISFEVYEGEIFVILGGSGCGKSTLLRHLVGLQPPLAGRIRIADEVVDPNDEAGYQRILASIGILYQSGALFGSMTVAENVALPIREYTSLPPRAVANLVRLKLGLVGLAGYEGHYPSQLSGGMRKRAGLARAMALNPRILFFDEPSAGLDPVTSAELDELILDLNRRLGTTMVLVTHELASIFAVGQRVIMLDRQSRGIIATGVPEELRRHSPNPQVRRFFDRQPAS